MTHAVEVLRRFRALDRALQQAGWPATSPWWHEQIDRFVTSGRIQLVLRVGRRGGKSSTLCRYAVVEALWGEHDVPPGDVGVVAFVSTTKDEANQRLRTISQILTALRVKYKPVPGGIEVCDARYPHRVFKVFAATIQGVSGFTSICCICDEVAKWKDADVGVNPATEVLASLRPTMGTQPNARIILASSPMGKWDAHYDAFEQGEDDSQLVAYAATWEANPSLSEDRTHQLEKDASTWAREWKGVPADEVAESLFTGTEIDACLRTPLVLPPDPHHDYTAAIDPGTRSSAWTLTVATQRNTPKGPVKSIVLAQEWRGSTKEPLSPKATLKAIKEILTPYRVDTIWTDQWSGDALRDVASDLGLTLVIEPWSTSTKLQAFKNLQTFVRTGQVELPEDPQLRQDLLGVRRMFTRAGISIDLLKTPDGRHSDFAPALAMVLARPLSEPRTPPAELGSAEWEKREKAKRIADYLQSLKPRQQWKPSEMHDRGPDAFWRRAEESRRRRGN